MKTTRQLCTFTLHKQHYVVPVSDVQEVIRFQERTRVPLAHPAVFGLINLRGQIVTAIDLRQRLNLPVRAADEIPMNIVVRTTDGPKSLLVDEIGDVIEVANDLGEPPPDTLRGPIRSMTTQVYKLADRLLLELDVPKLIDLVQTPTD